MTERNAKTLNRLVNTGLIVAFCFMLQLCSIQCTLWDIKANVGKERIAQ
jgi:hypothetical protein